MSERAIAPFVVGAAGGVASGLLGVGGGVVMVPLLVLWVGLDQRMAHAVSLAAIIPIAVAGSVTFLAGDRVDTSLAAILGVGGIAGTLVGVRLLDRIDEVWLRRIFAAFCLITGARMLIG